MVSQPAYLANLKAYAKFRYVTDDHGRNAAEDMVGESDRGAIILAATNVEDMLEWRILQLMPTLRQDEATRKQIFDQDGPIASFSRKTTMAYAMGIIDKPYRKTIDLIREIRNACAHSRHPISLRVPELRAACEVLISDTLHHLKDREPIRVRNAVLIRCAFVGHYVLTGEKIEKYEDQLVHWRKLHAEDGTSPPTQQAPLSPDHRPARNP